MITKPLKALVCQAILAMAIAYGTALPAERAKVVPTPGIEADALSVETDLSRGSLPKTKYPFSTSGSTSHGKGQTSYSSGLQGSRGSGSTHYTGSTSYGYQPRSSAAAFPSGQVLSPLSGLIPGQGCGPSYCGPTQPRVGSKQIELGAKIWYARMNTSTVIWGTNPIGNPGTQLDLNRDLGLGRWEYLYEADARCQIRCNWGVRYSFMNYFFEETDDVRTPFGFYFGYSYYPQFTRIYTKWRRYIHRAELIYDWYQQQHAVCSIFAGYSLYDDRLSIMSRTFNFQRARGSGFGLIHGGMSLDRAVTCVGGGVASLHCKWSVSLLEGYFGWDGTVTGRMHVPMNCGRYGFLEAGWRWIVLRRGEPSNTDETNIDGIMAGAGLVF